MAGQGLHTYLLCQQRDHIECAVAERNQAEWGKYLSWTHSEPLSTLPRPTESALTGVI